MEDFTTFGLTDDTRFDSVPVIALPLTNCQGPVGWGELAPKGDRSLRDLPLNDEQSLGRDLRFAQEFQVC